jgi:hypothetical protein
MTLRSTAKLRRATRKGLCGALMLLMAPFAQGQSVHYYITACGDYDLTGRVHCSQDGGRCAVVLFETSMAETAVRLTGPVGNLRPYHGHRVRVRARIQSLGPVTARLSRRAVRAGLVTGTSADAHLVEEHSCAAEATSTASGRRR